MMSELALWSIFVAVGAGTFAMRLSFIGLYGRLRIPPLLQRAMAYIPASVLAALVLPAVLLPADHGDFALANPQLPAAVVATFFAWWTRSTVLTLVAGMAVLWGLKLLGW